MVYLQKALQLHSKKGLSASVAEAQIKRGSSIPSAYGLWTPHDSRQAAIFDSFESAWAGLSLSSSIKQSFC